ncbi:MAG TPA: hypothetical protein VH497_16995 [Vicinamibacterales bacterium]|jgi:hypothetical protein
MPASIHEVSGRLQIREGGGGIAVFGLPFLAAGILATLGAVGIVPVSGSGGASALARPLLGLLGAVFTAVGGTLVFGRKWTTLDPIGRRIVRQWGALVPLREEAAALDDFSSVTIGFVRGDSDTVDKFPVALKNRAGADVKLFNATAYAEARAVAVQIAQHLHLDLEDATTDHPTHQAFDQLDRSFQSRAQRAGIAEPGVEQPSNARSTVTRDADQLLIVIPAPRPGPIERIAAFAPLVVPTFFGPMLVSFVGRTRTADIAGRIFLGVFVFGFIAMPVITCVNALVRSRRGRTIVAASREGILVQRRGAWRTRTVASIQAADIVDIDYSTRDSAAASARHAAVQQALQTHGQAAANLSPRTQWLVSALAGLARSGGVTIKSSQGLTTFGEGLDDDEVRYLHAMVRRAVQGR